MLVRTGLDVRCCIYFSGIVAESEDTQLDEDMRRAANGANRVRTL